MDVNQVVPLEIHIGEADTTAPDAPQGREQRCLCNKLTCVIRGDVVEIRCNKCKRMTYIYTRGIEGVRIK